MNGVLSTTVRSLILITCFVLAGRAQTTGTLSCSAAPPAGVNAPTSFSVSANSHYWTKQDFGATGRNAFIPIGHNRYDIYNLSDPANLGLTITGYVAQVAANGGNVIRLWAEQGDQNATRDFYLEYPAGSCNPSQVARLDELFAAADQYGVFIEICPWDTFNIKNNFAAFAYNKANGGPLASATEMISSAAARSLIKAKIKFMYDRWGQRKSFFLWTFNEIDILDTNATDQLSFAREIGSYIRSIDPYHSFTISYTGSGAGYPSLEQLSEIGAADIHFYGAISGTGAVAKENETATIRDGGYLNFGKPLVLSEWGVARKKNSDDLVNAVLWGGIAIGSSGGGLVWTDRYTYGEFTASQFAILKNLRAFTYSVNWNAFGDNHRAASAEVLNTGSGITNFACLNKSQAIVLLVASRVGSSTASTVTVKGLTPGSYYVDIWQTYAGGKVSTIRVATDAQGNVSFNSPPTPTMQALYVHP